MSSPEVILISGVGGPAGKSLAAQLRQRGQRVIGLDVIAVDTEVDQFIISPMATDPDYIPFLREVIARENVDLFIPTVQDELPVVSVAVPLLGAGVVVANSRAVQICHDKLFTALYLSERAVGVPAFAQVEDEIACEELVVKPRVSRGGRGVQVFDAGQHIGRISSEMVVQEFAGGTEYCPQCYRSPATGETTVIVLEKTELKDGRVGNASVVKRLDAEDEPDVHALAIDALKTLELYGPVDMDIRRRNDGEPVILEVNARFGANSAASPEILDHVLEDYPLPDMVTGGLRTTPVEAGAVR